MTETTNGEEQTPAAAAPNPTWGSDLAAFYQTGQVDTTGLGGNSLAPVFAKVRAIALQRAVDELNGDAPRGSGNIALDVDLRDPDVKAAVLEDLTAQLADAKAEAGIAEDEAVLALPGEPGGPGDVGAAGPAGEPPADAPADQTASAPADQPPADQPADAPASDPNADPAALP